jgi:hypothetical protein
MKVTLTTIGSLSNENSAVNALNQNFAALQEAVEVTLSRDGTTPNVLTASLDANSQRIVNLPAPVGNNDAARKIDITNGRDDINTAVSNGVTTVNAATTAGVATVNTTAAGATASASAAASSAIAASGSASAASTSATNANTSATNAAASATTAANLVLGYNGTSSSSVTVGSGNKTFTVAAGKLWQAGQRLRVINSLQTMVMGGTVSSYSGTSLVISVDYTSGSGTDTSWNITIVGETGAQGPQGASGSGSGDVTGPASAVNNGIALFNLTTGKLLKDGGAVGSLANKSSVNNSDWSGTPLSLGNGGTGATTAAGVRTAIGTVIGTDVQAWDADLDALAALSTTGLVARTAGNTFVPRTFTSTTGLAVTNGNGVSAAPNYALDVVSLTEDTTPDLANDFILTYDASATAHKKVKPNSLKYTEKFIIACSDETTALTIGTGKVTFRMPYAFTVTAVRASLTTAQTSGSIFTVDINESGTSIISTKLTIDNTEKTSVTGATPAVISDASLADDAEITIDIDQIGDGTAKGLKVTLIGYKT